jgi:hypothetical protein
MGLREQPDRPRDRVADAARPGGVPTWSGYRRSERAGYQLPAVVDVIQDGRFGLRHSPGRNVTPVTDRRRKTLPRAV